ncbi:hypothetical protein C3F09_07300 [candidate division GN15 bacterium]|uniref:Peptidase M20 dimerisation domain-containing protein n=1 Tax=candidate division GN15 bacterium TaxID=2072418 RepID=A0A855X047_9BACT|nr:MAG: hypothetical protein C3F09_07300 [candidate division GN15 bacterium]
MSGEMREFRVDIDYIVKTLKALIRINSVLPHEQLLAGFIADELKKMGLRPQLHETAKDRPNVYANAEFGRGGPFVVLSGHSDTVGTAADWVSDPFQPVTQDGRLYGLGAINMKSGLACCLGVMKSLVEYGNSAGLNGRVGLAVTVDQEGLSIGAEAMLQTEYAKCDAMLHAEHFFGDSQKDYLPLAGTGKVLYKLTIRGKSAHAFRPSEGGINAIGDAASIITALDRLNLRPHELYGRGTYCVLNVSGGPAQYSMVVPELCEVTITRLTVPGETRDIAVKDMLDLIDSLNLKSKVTVETPPPSYDPYQLDTETPFVNIFRDAYQNVVGAAPHFAPHRGITDANVFAKAGIPTIVFGPKGANHHKAGEYVELASLAPVAQVYVQTINRYLGDGE